eukprot:CAMPEP_0194355564 /NCGR_PEP_ID=MMETSP0174-20130528/3454_1 /TAXON_ID=216777 /ORGANISM="Proboscia alata, Strain PI-D3" /LENGTH=228 /DNA_ID=CAMNT_0039124883 /DNA_START=27 /DNA_END=713 /DNA_ORIENTATION=+
MKVFASILALATTAAAFAPNSVHRSETRLAAAIDEAFGVTVETGNKCTPLGARLLEDSQDGALEWFQNAEIKHGRIAMLATVGYMNQKFGVHFPLYLGPTGSNSFSPGSDDAWFLSTTEGITFTDIANAATPMDAVAMIPGAGLLQILFAAGIFEATAYNRQYNQEGRVPGDYGYDPLGFTKVEGGLESPKLRKLRIKEIKNGRLAMLAIAGWAASDAIPGSLPVWHP